mmetsp:Transcript_66782/g.155149  ORF Transcript_66782/g.155149 Transcript_66782/m.155149 type:complete len:230 (+) Transcript_66782:254-943(+)
MTEPTRLSLWLARLASSICAMTMLANPAIAQGMAPTTMAPNELCPLNAGRSRATPVLRSWLLPTMASTRCREPTSANFACRAWLAANWVAKFACRALDRSSKNLLPSLETLSEPTTARKLGIPKRFPVHSPTERTRCSASSRESASQGKVVRRPPLPEITTHITTVRVDVLVKALQARVSFASSFLCTSPPLKAANLVLSSHSWMKLGSLAPSSIILTRGKFSKVMLSI